MTKKKNNNEDKMRGNNTKTNVHGKNASTGNPVEGLKSEDVNDPTGKIHKSSRNKSNG